MRILVHADQFPQSRVRLQAAVALAKRHQASLIGLAVAPDPSATALIIGAAPADMVSMLNSAMTENLNAAEAQFMELAGPSGLEVEFRRDTGSTAECIARHARSADLTIVSQTDPEEDSKVWLDHSVPLLAGGPVLVVPYAGQFPAIGVRPLIAWNGSREAARAVRDAMPLLKAAGKADVLAVVEDADAPEPPDLRLADFRSYLARHGVTAKAEIQEEGDLDVAELVVSRMADLGTDLLVMGAYGHSRFREVVLGGVTREVLQSSPVPVLLAH